MKTPDEIKKGLECCGKGNSCRNHCPYDGRSAGIAKCTSNIARDALAYIQRLERKYEALLKDIGSVQGCICIICKKYINPNPGTGTAECNLLGRFGENGFEGALTCGQFEWRGVKEE